MNTKGKKRAAKKARMAAMYRGFFADPYWQKRVTTLKLDWCIPLHPRLVRDTAMGTRAHRE